MIGTHGRSIWILDNIAPLRQIAEAVARQRGVPLRAAARHARAVEHVLGHAAYRRRSRPGRIRPTARSSTTTCRETAKNRHARDRRRRTGRSFAATRARTNRSASTRRRFLYPTYWIRPHQALETSAGHHRFVWDLRYAPPRGARRTHAIAAIYQKTPSGPVGPFVHPGSYTVRLTVDGAAQQRPLDGPSRSAGEDRAGRPARRRRTSRSRATARITSAGDSRGDRRSSGGRSCKR